jgi:hypothetical protein
MKCDLCGEEMIHTSSMSWNRCFTDSCYEAGILYDVDDNMYRYKNRYYTPEEWQRVLKLKAFL